MTTCLTPRLFLVQLIAFRGQRKAALVRAVEELLWYASPILPLELLEIDYPPLA